jgi:predicted methyltransferase
LPYRIKLLLFFLSALAVLALMDVGYSALNTLSRLDAIEAQRDRWQRPADVIDALALNPGAQVVDLGCGSGYFTLKLSPRVAPGGHVLAEDIRRLPLAFLWVRTAMKGEHNVRIIHGLVSDPRLPSATVNAVLIVNTYHEFADPRSILAHVNSALIPGGRLVIVDREPKPQNIGVTEIGDHEIAPSRVEDDLNRAGFQIIGLRDSFISADPDNETWWMIVARKPLAS